ncbi:astacin [Cooperia oncophora]
MRLILLLLFLAVATHAGLLDLGKVKEFFKGGNLGEKIKAATLSKFKKLFEKTGVLSLGSKLTELRSKMMKKLQLSNEKKAEIDRKLKLFEKTGVLSLGSKLTELRSKMMKKLQLSNEKKAEIDRKLKEIEERRDDTVEDLKDTIFEINSEKNVGKTLFQSDILLTKRQQEEVMEGRRRNVRSIKRQAFKDQAYPNTTWQQGVFYRFDDGVDFITKRIFEKGAKQWEEATCLNFTEDKDKKGSLVVEEASVVRWPIDNISAENSIVLIKEDGCWSYVGRSRWLESLHMNSVTRLGSSTPCHDTIVMNFITVVLDNVVEGFVDQYVKETNETTTNYGFTYDYGSIMHYGAASASHNKKPTMQCARMRPSAKCQNGGFPHPRNCSECICPSGYGGTLCDKRPPGCGDTLKATERKQIIVKRLGFGGVRDEFEFCNYWIEADEGKKIEITVKSISHGYAHDGCILGGVEIKTTDDQTRTGYRFCSPTYRDAVLVSASNRVPIIMFNRAGQQQFILEYKIKS